MANKHKTLKELFDAIADAIRFKTGGTAKIVADNFPTEIKNILTGNTEQEDALVSGRIIEYSNSRVTSIGNYAFNFMGQLETADLPNVISVGSSAFEGCYRLANITMPKLAYIGAGAFLGCNSLKKLDINGNCNPEDLGSTQTFGLIGNNAFLTTGLKALIIRSSLGRVPVLLTDAFGEPERPEEACPIGRGEGFVYVPAAMVDSYKMAENWSVYADQIRAIEDYPEITGGAT